MDENRGADAGLGVGGGPILPLGREEGEATGPARIHEQQAGFAFGLGDFEDKFVGGVDGQLQPASRVRGSGGRGNRMGDGIEN